MASELAASQASQSRHNDYMGFGKHATKTYKQVKDRDESYRAWAVKECDKTSSPEFIRFVSWLNSATVAPAAAEGATARPSGPEYELKAPTAKLIEGTWPVRRIREDQLMDDEATEDGLLAEQKEVKEMMKQMMGMMEKMEKRVSDVEKDARSSAASSGGFANVNDEDGRPEDDV